MKAIIHTQYGSPDVLQLRDIEKPAPNANEVLIKVHASSVNTGDKIRLYGDPFVVRFDTGLNKPKLPILGADVAGTIEAVGQNVTEFQVGDAVFGDLSSTGWGGFAEYVTTPVTPLVKKPANLTFEEAAVAPVAGVTALKGLREKGQIQAGQKVLIHGASGGVGAFAVQIAKAFGAEVTAVCSTSKVELVRALGADYVIDYTQADFVQTGKQYDLIFAANGNRSIFDYLRALTPDGKYICSGGDMRQVFQVMLLGPILSKLGKQTFTNYLSVSNRDKLTLLAELMETSQVRPVIDRCYPLSETAEALRYLESGRARGKVVISVLSA